MEGQKNAVNVNRQRTPKTALTQVVPALRGVKRDCRHVPALGRQHGRSWRPAAAATFKWAVSAGGRVDSENGAGSFPRAAPPPPLIADAVSEARDRQSESPRSLPRHSRPPHLELVLQLAGVLPEDIGASVQNLGHLLHREQALVPEDPDSAIDDPLGHAEDLRAAVKHPP